jgi:hypothetical protein
VRGTDPNDDDGGDRDAPTDVGQQGPGRRVVATQGGNIRC